MNKLHPTQEKLIQALEDNIADPLTVRELQELLGLSTPSLVTHHIQQLEKKGYLKRNPYNPQDYYLLKSPESQVAFLNLYGLAQCGPDGTLLDGNPEDRIAVSSRLLDFPVSEGFLVKARGDSMEPLISEGDLVITRKSSTPREGSLIVCVNDGLALIKRYHSDGNTIFLQSENPRYAPIIAKDFRIEGEVHGVIAKIN